MQILKPDISEKFGGAYILSIQYVVQPSVIGEKWLCIQHMGDFTQPRQKFAAAGEIYNFVIAVNVCPIKRTF